jgi:hypothetical protein
MLRVIDEPAGDQLPTGAPLRQRATDPIEVAIDNASGLAVVDPIGVGAQPQDGLIAIAPAKPAPPDDATAR